jgi:hypothetical protein
VQLSKALQRATRLVTGAAVAVALILLGLSISLIFAIPPVPSGRSAGRAIAAPSPADCRSEVAVPSKDPQAAPLREPVRSLASVRGSPSNLFSQDVAVTGVTGEILDQEQVDKPEADVTQSGMRLGVIESKSGGDRAGTLAGALEFGDHIDQCFAVGDNKTALAGSGMAVAFAFL